VYNQSELAQCAADSSYPVSVKERLEEQYVSLTKRLKEIEELKVLLEKNPEIERVLTLLRNHI